MITFDGYDGPDLVCPRINVWKKGPGGKRVECAGHVWHGQKAKLLTRHGTECKVRIGEVEGLVEIPEGTPSDFEGWVTFWFIKELKSKWQKRRLK